MTERNLPCTEETLKAADHAVGVRLPERLRELFRQADGRYQEQGEWWVLWPLDRVVADTNAASSQGSLSRALIAIGDDGNGNPFCVRTDGEVEVSKGALQLFLEKWTSE